MTTTTDLDIDAWKKQIDDWETDLFLDGFISHTLTPLYTERYLNLFVKCLENERRGSFVGFDGGWVVARSKQQQQQQQLHLQQQQQRRITTTNPNNRRPRPSSPPPPPPALPPPARRRVPKPPQPEAADDVLENPETGIGGSCTYEMFDRKVNLLVGTVVPQPTWIGVSERTGVLCPIFFVRSNGALGVPYENPAPVRSRLHNAMETAPGLLRRRNQNMRIRIQWPGYEEFHYEFRILDRKLGKLVPVTMSRVVERVMRGIHRLCLEGKRDPKTFNERWKLGEGGIKPEEITIIGLLHISKGTWVPILQLARHVIPRWDWLLQESQEKQSEESSEED